MERDRIAEKYFIAAEEYGTGREKTITWIHEICRDIVINAMSGPKRERKKSASIDNLLLNKYSAMPIFLFVILAIFIATFYSGGYISGFISQILKFLSFKLTDGIDSMLVKDLIEQGVFAGAGNILTLIPYIFIMVLLLKSIEDIGYSARVAYIMDEVMAKIGLHGKSFIPMILGFGCTVPAIMSSRTIDSYQDRLKTILITPFIPCSSRFMVAAFLTAALFGKNAYIVLFLLYLIDIVFAFIGGFILDKLIIKSERQSIILEMPDYKRLNLKNVFAEAFRESSEFLKKAASIILVLSIAIFFLSHFPVGAEYGYIGMAAEKIQPLFSIFEFDSPMTVSLITGFAAKESIISTLSVMYEGRGSSLQDYVANNWSKSGGFIFLIFSMLYIPCVASVAAIRRETKSLKWTLFAVVYSFVLSFTAAITMKLGISLWNSFF